jgi:hypothetical protein
MGWQAPTLLRTSSILDPASIFFEQRTNVGRITSSGRTATNTQAQHQQDNQFASIAQYYSPQKDSPTAALI